MVDIFKNWVSIMLCMGIFVTFVQLIIPKTNLKKYIYSLIGIVTILTVVAPVIDIMKNKDVEESVAQVIANISDEGENTQDLYQYENANKEALKEGFIQGMKNDIISKLENKGIDVNEIEIFLTEQYNVEKLEVKIKKIDNNKASINSVNDVVKYINEEYMLDFSKITVIEGD